MTAATASGPWRGALVPLAIVGVLAFALLRLHGGWPGWNEPTALRVALAVLAVLAYASLCGALWFVRLRRRLGLAVEAESAGDDALLVAWASQTGYAEQLALQTAQSLRAAGVAVRARPLAAIDAASLARTARALFVVSTTGEGDAPDSAAGFVRDVLGHAASLPALRYGVLALGDREYRQFCGFGHRLDQWLRGSGAQPWFDAVEVDDGDPGALRHWQHEIGVVTGCDDLPDWQPPRYEHWTLAERRLLNPDSLGGGCFHLVLRPTSDARFEWRAGDIAEIGPRHAPDVVEAWLRDAQLAGDAWLDDGASLRELAAASRLPPPDASLPRAARAIATRLVPLPHREYSIASIPSDGAIELLVRQVRHADGGFGLGSGWLTRHAPLGAPIALRIRANTNFHAPDPQRPLLLIGNGTGIAGLRALLKERAAAGARRNWLLFGERQRDRDFHYRDEIERWLALGVIERLDLAFSRDGGEQRYVQHHLAAASDALRAWVGEGAAVYVCGSLEGMAPAVDAVLADALGHETLQQMRTQGRYRRDVY